LNPVYPLQTEKEPVEDHHSLGCLEGEAQTLDGAREINTGQTTVVGDYDEDTDPHQ